MKGSFGPAASKAAGRALVRVVLLGPPGAGKGSLASLYQSRLGMVHISTGEIFRQEIARNSTLGQLVKRLVAGGRLVPDALVVKVMAARLDRRTLVNGFVLDGFPRTQGQAVGLDRVLNRQGFPLDGAVYLACSPQLLMKRLSGRRTCVRCGANYHLRTMRPRRQGRCDRCGGSLIIRKDDKPATIRKRLAIDGKASKPLMTYYQQRGSLYRVNGGGRIEAVFKRTVRLFQQQGWLENHGVRTRPSLDGARDRSSVGRDDRA